MSPFSISPAGEPYWSEPKKSTGGTGTWIRHDDEDEPDAMVPVALPNKTEKFILEASHRKGDDCAYLYGRECDCRNSNNITELTSRQFKYCPFCGRMLAIIFCAHDCNQSDF